MLISLILAIAKTVLKFVCVGNSHLPIPVSDTAKSEILFWIHFVFNIASYIPFFAMGVIFHKLYKEYRIFDRKSILLIAATVLTTFIHGRALPELILIVLMYVLFSLMIYREKAISFLNNPLFIRIGVLSYTMYLIHEPIGVLCIKLFSSYLGPLSILAPWILTVLVFLFAELVYRFYEKKVHTLLKNLLFSNQQQKKAILSNHHKLAMKKSELT